MGANSSNAGFVGLMTPVGIVVLLFSILLLIAIIVFGAGLIRAGEARSRAYRAELKRMKEEHDARQS